MEKVNISYHLDIQRKSDDILVVHLSGSLNNEETLDILDKIVVAFSELQNGFMILVLDGFTYFPWKLRTTLIGKIVDGFADGHFQHIYVVSPNVFIKTLGFLAQKVYRTIKYSFSESLNEALLDCRYFDNLENKWSPENIKKGLISDENWKELIVKEVLTDANENEAFIALVKPNLIISWYKGKLTGQLVNFIYDFHYKHLPKTEGHWHYILDLSRVKQPTREARKVFEKRDKEIDTYLASKHYKFGRAMQVLMKAYAYVNKTFAETINVVDDIFLIASQIKKGEKTIKENLEYKEKTFSFGSDIDENLDILSKEELIELVHSIHKEHNNFRNTTKKHVLDAVKSVSNIVFNEKYTVEPLNTENVRTHEFFELFQTINLLQYESVTLINELEFTNNNLQKIVAERTREIEDSKRKLEAQNSELIRLNNELDTFVYRSSHDMRAPIATLLGLLEMAKNESNLEKKKGLYDFMDVSIQKLDEFIHEITLMTKNSKFELQIEAFNLLDLIQEVLAETAYHKNFSDIDIRLQVHAAIVVNTDRFRLKTILKNLISNSIKYSKNVNSWVEINHKDLGNKLNRITVADNGQGIPKEHLENVFKMFHRANLRSKGSGLGLYIVKEAASKINGNINLESEEGKGTTVTLEFAN
ncbi:MAG: HAMP domain-containing histidine kinase [Bacteroidia bacterium]